MASHKKKDHGKNLLRNNNALKGLEHWEILEQGGDGFQVEESPQGSKPISDLIKHKREGCCWATSHELCEKRQIVDLKDAGYDDSLMDEKKPPIRVREWYCARDDCGCEYHICVRLLNAEKKELDKWEFTDTKEAGSDWIKVKKIFKDYPPGVRYIEFRHGGKDTKCWAGHFGVKLAMPGVFVDVKKKSNSRGKRSAGGKSDRNLIKNTCACDGLNFWEVTENGGDGFAVEDEPQGSAPIKKFATDLPEDAKCWTTSHGMCKKKVLIDLTAEGVDGNLIDERRPKIKISEWYASRNDCGCEYNIKVRLLNESKDEVDKWEFSDTKEPGTDWYQASHLFSDYGPGVRFIEYTHGGKDTKGWAGRYGVKITGSSVVVAADDKSPTSSSDED
ncbi:hypothetical protein ACJMK2_035959 [Sinanodonta woodiana]|uniref:FBA domain-containing protein n=1 Tax=Sinanodonta woodiana TaxID=1069815 RepID=A0ABD3WJS6_SINWO